MNIPRTITIIGTVEEPAEDQATHESPTVCGAETPVGRILTAMCDGGDIIENRQGLTRITLAADTGNSQPAPRRGEPQAPGNAMPMHPMADDPPWTREQTLTNIRVRAEHRITGQSRRSDDASDSDDQLRTRASYRSGAERDRRNQ